jgi:ribosomal protein S18 acetylase RimI-like enzyme
MRFEKDKGYNFAGDKSDWRHMVDIKLLGPNDLEILSNVAPDVFDDPIDFTTAMDFLQDIRHRLMVVMDEGLVVGFTSAVIYVHPDKPKPELWINEVGIASTHRGRGIGKMLLQRMLESGQQAGCSEAWVLTERTNDAAMGLYSSLGGIEEVPDPVMFTFKL